MSITIVVKNFKTLTDGFKRQARAAPIGLRKGLRKAMALVLRESRKIVPIDTKALYNSGYAKITKDQTGLFEGEVGYDSPYGIYVHEDLEAVHGEAYNVQYSYEIAQGQRYTYHGQSRIYHSRRPQEQAKFLTSVVYGHIDDLRRIVREEVDKAKK